MKKEPDQKDNKSRLRQALRQRRREIDELHRNVLDTAINTHLAEFVRGEGHRVIAAYLAFDGEPDLHQALTQLAQEGVTLALPVVHDVPGRDFITFRQWEIEKKLARNRFGIREPVDAVEIPLAAVDLVLVPLVGWDRNGGRLGMGASFYDRMFQPFSLQDRPLRMGVGYGVQETGEIPLDHWDIRLHAMLTENGWFTCPG